MEVLEAWLVTYEGTEVNEVPTDQIWYSLNIRIMAVTDKIETYGSTLIQSPKLDEELDFQVVSRPFSSKQFLHMKNNFPAKKPPHITITKLSKRTYPDWDQGDHLAAGALGTGTASRMLLWRTEVVLIMKRLDTAVSNHEETQDVPTLKDVLWAQSVRWLLREWQE